jgi:tRNA pseudouridine65 synthase
MTGDNPSYTPDDIPVLFRDEHIAVVYKPRDLLVHRTELSTDSVVLLQLVRHLVGSYVYPAHRIDRATSGIVVFALHPEAAGAIQRQFAEHTVRKCYAAIVRGTLQGTGTTVRALQQERVEAPPSTTAWKSIAHAEIANPCGRYQSSRFSLVAAMPVTGRRHQIRRHMASLAHPIIGDVKHGDTRQNLCFETYFGLRRLHLYATSIAFAHPDDGRTMVFHAPPDAESEPIFHALGWQQYVRDDCFSL